MLRRLRFPLLLLALFSSRTASAVDLTDPRDDFRFSIDPPGMPACVTYPPERFDRVECEGLDMPREAALRASSAPGTQWVGTAVFRGDSWGFRLAILRADVPPGPVGEASDLALLRLGEESVTHVLGPGQLVGGERGLEKALVTLNGVRVARFSYAFKAEGLGVLRTIAYLVPSDIGAYTLSFVADQSRAKDLEAIVDHALPTLHVRPRPRSASLLVTLSLYIGIPLVALFGVGFLLARLASERRGRNAEVLWPGLRDDGRK